MASWSISSRFSYRSASCSRKSSSTTLRDSSSSTALESMGREEHMPTTYAPAEAAGTVRPTKKAKPWYRQLWAHVVAAMIIGVLLGHFYPDLGARMQPFGDGFIKAIRMLIGPIIFCTVVHGIAKMADMTRV